MAVALEVRVAGFQFAGCGKGNGTRFITMNRVTWHSQPGERERETEGFSERLRSQNAESRMQSDRAELRGRG